MQNKTLSTRKNVLFSVSAEPGNKVYLTGTFNGWQPDSIRMTDKGDGHFQYSLPLPNGRHEYKFIIDKKWVADPQCRRWNANEHGSLNSVIYVTN